MITVQAFTVLSQPADISIPITASQEASQGRLLLGGEDLASSQHSTLLDLPCHSNVVKPVPQKDISSSEYACNTSRHLLAVKEAPDRTSEHDAATIDTDLTSTAPQINSTHASDSKFRNTPTQDVKDAADQQAMQHGADAVATSRELHRQLGQRFDKSPAVHGSAQNTATAGQTPPEQSEITPGNGQRPHHLKAVCKPMPPPLQ